MGFKAWRYLGVWALAGASLVGCTNGAQKDTRGLVPTPPTDQKQPWNIQPGQQPPAPNPAVFNNQQQPNSQSANPGLSQQRSTNSNFPQIGSSPNASSGLTPNSGSPSLVGGAPQMNRWSTANNPGTSTSLTTPSPGMPQSGSPQPSTNSSLQPTGFGAGNPPLMPALQPSPSVPGTPSAPNPFQAAPNSSFTPLQAPPPGFGTVH